MGTDIGAQPVPLLRHRRYHVSAKSKTSELALTGLSSERHASSFPQELAAEKVNDAEFHLLLFFTMTAYMNSPLQRYTSRNTQRNLSLSPMKCVRKFIPERDTSQRRLGVLRQFSENAATCMKVTSLCDHQHCVPIPRVDASSAHLHLKLREHSERFGYVLIRLPRFKHGSFPF